MNKEELIKVYAYTQAIFGSFSIPKDKNQLESQNLVWLKYLKPYGLEIIYTAIDMYAIANQFVNIAQIAELCERTTQIKNGKIKDEYFYLQEISQAVSYNKCKENFNNLSDFSKEVVGGSHKLAQWSMAGETFDTIIVNRILKEIKNKLENDKVKNLLSTNNQLLIESKARKELKQ